MNEIWQQRLREHRLRIKQESPKKKLKKLCLRAFIILLILNVFYPQYLKRLIYPYLIGKPTVEAPQYDTEETFEDIEAEEIIFTRKSRKFYLQQSKIGRASCRERV